MIKKLTVFLLIISASNLYSQKVVKMVEVEGANFKMGSSSKQFTDENPIHEVTLNSFYISQFEILFDDYSAFCKTAGYPEPTGQVGYPATMVTWEKAVMFCNWLSGRDGFEHAYKIERNDTKKIFNVECNFETNGYRLPTEAEWEFAAKGGVRSKNYIFSGSNSPYNVSWFSENYKGNEQKPGEKFPNELGIYDMSGNVGEWCWDYYDQGYYKKSEKLNPKGSKAKTDRVFRGGTRRNKMEFIKISRRFHKDQKERDSFLGFRVVRTKTK